MRFFNKKKYVLTLIVLFVVLLEVFAFNLDYFKNGSDTNTELEYVMRDIPVYEDEYYLVEVVIDSSESYKFLNFKVNDIEETSRDEFIISKSEHPYNLQLELLTKAEFLVQFGKSEFIETISSLEASDYNNYIYNGGSANRYTYYIISEQELQMDDFTITGNNDFEFNIIRFIAYILILISCYLVIMYHEYLLKNKHVFAFLLILSFGMITAFISRPNVGFDEYAHYIKSYQSSYNVMSDCMSDEFTKLHEIQTATDTYKERMMQFEYFEYDNSKCEYLHSSAESYPDIVYLPSTIGVVIGRLLHLDLLGIFYLGKITSIIMYAFVSAAIIYFSQRFKNVILLLTTAPTMIFAAGTYTVDWLTFLAMTAAVVAIVNIFDNKKADRTNILLFTISVCILTFTKIPYSTIVLLCLFIPSKFFDNKKVYFKTIALILLSFIVFFLLSAYISVTSGIAQFVGVIEDVDPRGQIEFLFTNPLYFIKDSLRILEFYLKNNLTELLLYYGWGPYNIFTPIYSVITQWSVILVILVFYMVIVAEDFALPLRLKIGNCIVALIVWFSICGALYLTFTPVGSFKVDGIQLRYLTPFAMIILVTLSNNKIMHAFSKDGFDKFIMGVSYIGVVILLIAMLTSIA